MTTTTTLAARKLRVLVWLRWERGRLREWNTYREKGWNVHVLGGNGLFVVTVRTHREYGREAILERRVFQRGDVFVPWEDVPVEVRRCSSTRAAKATAVARADADLCRLERALLSDTGMTSAAIQLLAEMCDNDASLHGEALLAAARVAQTATAGLGQAKGGVTSWTRRLQQDLIFRQ